MKISHLADIHGNDKDLEEVIKCCEFIIATARDEQPDLIAVAGDVFDSRNIKADSKCVKYIFRFFSEFADIAPVAVVLGTPSHDGKTAQVLRYIKAKYPIWVSDKPEMLCLFDGGLRSDWQDCNPVPEAIISMCPTPTKRFYPSNDAEIAQTDAEIGEAMTAIFAGFGATASKYSAPHALIGHFQTKGARVSETQELIGKDIEISKDQLALAKADIICLGHAHLPQPVGDNGYYSGEIRCMEYRIKTHKAGFYIHEIEYLSTCREKNLIVSRFIETPTRKLIKLEFDLVMDEPLFDSNHICSICCDEDGNPDDNIRNAFIKFEIKIYQNDIEKLDKKEVELILLDDYGAAGVDIHTIIVPRVNVRSEKILQLETLPDKLVEMARLKGETVPDSILKKAAILDTESHDDIIQQVKKGNVLEGIPLGSALEQMVDRCNRVDVSIPELSEHKE